MVSNKWYNRAKPILDYIVCPIGIKLFAVTFSKKKTGCLTVICSSAGLSFASLLLIFKFQAVGIQKYISIFNLGLC